MGIVEALGGTVYFNIYMALHLAMLIFISFALMMIACKR